jgi:site-specific DNA recombinase
MEKWRILDFIFSNCLWKNGRLIATHKKPFDMLALTKVAYEDKKAASQVKSLFEIWLTFVSEYRTLCTIHHPR